MYTATNHLIDFWCLIG